MRIYYDTEFHDTGRTIDLISIGLVAEDGKELYRINGGGMGIPGAANNKWLRENVLPSLPVKVRHRSEFPLDEQKFLNAINAAYYPTWVEEHPDFQHVCTGDKLRRDVHNFLTQYKDIELWAYYAAYDHVALAQIYGPMINLPLGIPMYTHDLMQEWDRLGRPTLPKQSGGNHNALADARHNRIVGDFLAGIEARNKEFIVNMTGSTVMSDSDMDKFVSRVSRTLVNRVLPAGGVRIKKDPDPTPDLCNAVSEGLISVDEAREALGKEPWGLPETQRPWTADGKPEHNPPYVKQGDGITSVSYHVATMADQIDTLIARMQEPRDATPEDEYGGCHDCED